MFFLGIAGSFLPYLIGVGLMFFLTLGINKDKEVMLAGLDEKNIAYFFIGQSYSATEEDSYFFGKISNVKNIDQSTQFKFCCVDFFDYSLVINISTSNTPVHEEIYRTSRSGLSPPVLIF